MNSAGSACFEADTFAGSGALFTVDTPVRSAPAICSSPIPTNSRQCAFPKHWPTWRAPPSPTLLFAPRALLEFPVISDTLSRIALGQYFKTFGHRWLTVRLASRAHYLLPHPPATFETASMKKIPSFTVNHLTLRRWYVSRVGDEITTFDVRMKRPTGNRLCTSMPFTPWKTSPPPSCAIIPFGRPIHWGPMGCLTGNYFDLKGGSHVDRAAAHQKPSNSLFGSVCLAPQRARLRQPVDGSAP